MSLEYVTLAFGSYIEELSGKSSLHLSL